jgi:HAD superfamily hydrolase (TIGR01509 family)
MPLVLFDLDNTLIDRAASFRRWATHFAEAHSVGPEDVAWLVATDEDGYATRHAFITAVQQRYAVPGSLDVLLDDYRAALVAEVKLDPVIPPALDGLRDAGWRIAIATNGGARQQAAKIRQAGLDRYVDAVAISGEVGAAKPDRRLFEAAAQRCGARLSAASWMVGDCPDRDVAGAQQLGIKTIWMRRGRLWDPAAAPPTAAVENIPQAAGILLAGP